LGWGLRTAQATQVNWTHCHFPGNVFPLLKMSRFDHTGFVCCNSHPWQERTSCVFQVAVRHTTVVLSRYLFVCGQPFSLRNYWNYTLTGQFIRYTIPFTKMNRPTNRESFGHGLLYKAGRQASRHPLFEWTLKLAKRVT
jgi:hypothetical protein